MSDRSSFHVPFFLVFFFFCTFLNPSLSAAPHAISFRSPNLYPESFAWDPSAQHFLAGSLRGRYIVSVSDAGVVETFISDPSLPHNATFLGLAVDSRRNRLLAAVHAAEPLPPFDALAAYDLRTRRRVFLAELPDPDSHLRRPTASGVAVGPDGSAYVTNSIGNSIWKVSAGGEPSIFSRSPAFAPHPVDRDAPCTRCGLNGIAYVHTKEYLLAVQSNTGKLFKVRADDGAARPVPLTADLALADGIAVRGDGVAVVVSPHAAWFVRSDDSWGQGVVYDRTALAGERSRTSVAVGGEGRVYVGFGHLEEGITGNAEREWFGIEEVRAESEAAEEWVWVYVLLGFGLAYFMFWRFQMAQLVKNMNKKTN